MALFRAKCLHVSCVILGALTLLAGATRAHAAQDVVHFEDAIDVPASQSIHDAVCFFCSVNVDGRVTGDIVSFFGHVHVRGQADHDVVNFFGGVQVGDESEVGRSLVNFFGSVRLGRNAKVGQDLVLMFGSLRKEPSATIEGDQVTQPAALFWVPFVLISVAICFVVREIRGQRRRRLLRGF